MPNVPQARYWLLTIPAASGWQPPQVVPVGINYLKGQKEIGEGGYEHWQVLVAFKDKKRLAAVKAAFNRQTHAEPTRSSAANDYVWKDDTAVLNTRFELGLLPTKRNVPTDWDRVWSAAKKGKMSPIPKDVAVRYYGNLKKIFADNMAPLSHIKTVKVFIGPTGTGKSATAWSEAGYDMAVTYTKDPRTKFWDGYRGQKNVIIDEFRGAIDIAHMLRWLDRYPCNVEVKGSSVPLAAENFWITSNLAPENWYPDCDRTTVEALLRRLDVADFTGRVYVPPLQPQDPVDFLEMRDNDESIGDLLRRIHSQDVYERFLSEN